MQLQQIFLHVDKTALQLAMCVFSNFPYLVGRFLVAHVKA